MELLYVEDEYTQRNIVIKNLKHSFHNIIIHEATTEEQAKKIFDRCQDTLDLIITDGELDSGRGEDLIEYIRVERKYNGPVCFMSDSKPQKNEEFFTKIFIKTEGYGKDAKIIMDLCRNFL